MRGRVDSEPKAGDSMPCEKRIPNPLKNAFFSSLLLLSTVLSFTLNAQLVSSAATSAGDIIAYCLCNSASSQIYTVNADGTGSARLVNSSLVLNEPAYSPDGKYLVMSGYRGATLSIYRYTFSAGTVQLLTSVSNVWDNHPTYSPQGSIIAFSRGYPPDWARNEIWLMNSDGTNARSIGVEGYHVHFSPDGMRLAYSSGVPGSQEIFTCALDGTRVQQLTKNNFDDGSPSWSPDGRKIVFDSNRDGNTDIYVMNSDGTQVRRLTNSFPAMSAVPEWSPDGTQIVFSRNVSGSPNGQIFVMDADGSNTRQVTQVASPGWAQEPTWKLKSTTSIQNGSETALPQDVRLYQPQCPAIPE